jgi:hypothetical protein
MKADHPFWGYRRIWAHLWFVDGLLINKKKRAAGDTATRPTGEDHSLAESHADADAEQTPADSPAPVVRH